MHNTATFCVKTRIFWVYNNSPNIEWLICIIGWVYNDIILPIAVVPVKPCYNYYITTKGNFCYNILYAYYYWLFIIYICYHKLFATIFFYSYLFTTAMFLYIFLSHIINCFNKILFIFHWFNNGIIPIEHPQLIILAKKAVLLDYCVPFV